MLTFALLAWWALERFLERSKWYDALLFIVASGLGLLSHFTFVFASAALGFLSLKGGAKKALAINLIPLAFTYLLWNEFIRKMRYAGGPRIGLLGAINQYSDHTLGVVAIPIVVLCVIGIVRYLKYDGWMLAVILGAMGGVLLIKDPRYLYARYFIAFTPFLLVLMARWMATWTSRDAVLAVMILWLFGQASLAIPFVRYGRGPYREALRYMGEGTVASSFEGDFHDRTLIGFYGGHFSRKQPAYLTSAVPVDQPRELDRYGAHYVYDRKFPFQGISGTPWHIWRRQDAFSTTPPTTAAAADGAADRD
jgi:hypothetical protein